jgi:hypothetical protein
MIENGLAGMMFGQCSNQLMSQNVWIITSGAGLNLLNMVTEEIKTFGRGNGYCLASDDILALAQGSDGTLLLGTYDAGLIQFDPTQMNATLALCGLPGRDRRYQGCQRQVWLSTSSGLAFSISITCNYSFSKS